MKVDDTKLRRIVEIAVNGYASRMILVELGQSTNIGGVKLQQS